MKLKKLIKEIPGIEVKGSKEVEVASLCNNSKLAAPGALFFAKKGLTTHGNAFIGEAISSGAVAIVTDLYDPFLSDVVQVIYPDVALLEAILAGRFYQDPSQKLVTVGVTGTNGKTTISYLVKHLFDRIDKPCGLIGTIEWIVGNNVFPAAQTTPDVLTNHKLFHEMVSVGCKGVVMEVSSHALCQGRVGGIDFDYAIFTNLTQDHLDYHITMEQYAEAKARLFSSLSLESEKPYPKRAIVNGDSPWSASMIRECKVPILTYGLSKQSDVWADNLSLSSAGAKYQVHYQGKQVSFTSSLIGKFNVYNTLAVFSLGIALGCDLHKVAEILQSCRPVPGRLERVPNQKEKNIFVDYAHTEDALKNVLETLREVAKGKIVCVFGCGGNRDKLKRPKMGRIVEALADRVIVTSDNPRGEDPQEIIREILSGFHDASAADVQIDRRQAIEQAIGLLKEDDVLLIAGKGHETTQVFSRHAIHFDDRIVAKEYCQSLG